MRSFRMMRFKVEGLNLDRLTKRLAKQVELFDLERQSHGCLCFSVRTSHREKALAIMNEKCYTVSVIVEGGASRLRQSALLRVGLLVGAVAAAMCVWLYSTFIWGVEISGCNRLSIEQVNQILGEAGIERGAKKSAVDKDELELLLSLNPQVASASVQVRGSRLVVLITEVLDYEDGIDPNQKRNIYSDCDGIVKEVLVLAGTARVEVGSMVKAGDILIEGVTEDADNQPLREVWALGKVSVGTWVRAQKTFSLTEMGIRRTGRTQTVKQVMLYGKPYGFSSLPSTDFEHYEKEVIKSPLFRGQLLPFQEVVTVFYECEEYQVLHDLELRKQEIITLLTQNLLYGNEVVVGSSHNVREINGLIMLELYIELLREFE